ncbi:MAG: acetylornithine deacetylase [Bacteroidetes bacterium 24-39-8]|jgi:acetylornithine deacetylase|nr:MAG: acetylornithine deacetylase [Sphingobacteriia bacterium 35-40-8]OYZ48431.1 MAG: acetylornithine deacetylase [Bacteroidetes bacterium 24-39-8]OZA67625.1 MAG: acetylornithine deacetylase [Sphingobacteriia bacterium 39-39-8]HQR92702.1 M20 family metallo-hydrolase [Sediminibacterium sp.]HQS54967.1 M20 family metallo-hydrolase [Sediminibacterium sp.]
MNNNNDIQGLTQDAISLLKQLIAIPSLSKEEDNTADLIEQFLQAKGVTAFRFLNNVWAKNQYFSPEKPTLLLNSHHDTVKPNKAYTLNPFEPIVKDEKLYGLGSNDAGGCLVSLIATFLHYYHRSDLQYNLVLAATAEEEISGHNGVEILLPRLPKIDCGIVGEPTLLQMAVAEKGLLVLDCTATGKPGHAAREEGDNAIYKAIKDIQWFKDYRFDRVSDLLGPMKMTVTIINAGSQHNVVPHECKFTTDVRVNELYTFEEVLEIIRANTFSDVQPRSSRLRSTSIALDHPLVKSGIALGRTYYGSPTTSDKALMPFPTLKFGPGDSARSHSADEFIWIHEIGEGIDRYIQLIDQVIVQP